MASVFSLVKSFFALLYFFFSFSKAPPSETGASDDGVLDLAKPKKTDPSLDIFKRKVGSLKLHFFKNINIFHQN